jgi:hypothetical protein
MKIIPAHKTASASHSFAARENFDMELPEREIQTGTVAYLLSRNVINTARISTRLMA